MTLDHRQQGVLLSVVMPPLPSPGQVVEIKLVGNLGSDADLLNRLFMSYTGSPPAVGDLLTFSNAIATAWQSDLASLISSDYTLENVVVTDLSSDTGATANTTPAYAGTDSSGCNAGTALVVKLEIARRYRGGHPRKYLGGISNAHVTADQKWNATYLDSMDAGWTSFSGDIVAATPSGMGTGAMVNVSWFSGFTAVENPITHRYRNVPTLRATPLLDVITGYLLNPNLASQRRRNQQGSVTAG